MKETASQSDKADRRYTGLKLGFFEQKLDKPTDILRYVVKNPVRYKYIYIYIYLAGFTRKCLLTCDKAGTGDLQPVGFSVATVTTVHPC